MVKFIGEYSAKVDDKGRVVFPSAFKSIMPADDMRFVIRKDVFEPCLEMFTYEEWERQSEELKSKLNFLKREHAIFWREYMRSCAIVEPDAKVGRISIPAKLKQEIGISKEIIFSGCDHKIEIWDKSTFETSQITNEEYISLAGMLSDL